MRAQSRMCITCVSWLLLWGCATEDSGTGPGDGGLGTSQNSGLGCFFDFGGTGDQQAALGECDDCMRTNCGDEMLATFGSRGIPTRPGGACGAFITCLEQCTCDDNADDNCVVGCTESVDSACQTAVIDFQACAGACDAACGDLDGGGDPSEPLDVCTEPEAVISGPASFTATGNLDDSDRSGGPRGALFEIYELQLAAGQRATIRHTSEAFDAYLFVADSSCNTLTSDDDGAGGFDSEVVWTADSAQTLFVVATTFSGAESGPFTLQVTFD